MPRRARRPCAPRSPTTSTRARVHTRKAGEQRQPPPRPPRQPARAAAPTSAPSSTSHQTATPTSSRTTDVVAAALQRQVDDEREAQQPGRRRRGRSRAQRARAGRAAAAPRSRTARRGASIAVAIRRRGAGADGRDDVSAARARSVFRLVRRVSVLVRLRAGARLPAAAGAQETQRPAGQLRRSTSTWRRCRRRAGNRPAAARASPAAGGCPPSSRTRCASRGRDGRAVADLVRSAGGRPSRTAAGRDRRRQAVRARGRASRRLAAELGACAPCGGDDGRRHGRGAARDPARSAGRPGRGRRRLRLGRRGSAS